MAPLDPLIGQTVGSYRIDSVIGAGGMGKVYLGVHPQIGSRVAIKVLSQQSLKQPELVERFFVEAKAVNAINHENIVNILDMATLPDGRPYIVMEYLEGAPLATIIRARGPLPLGSLARLACEVLDALDAAHRTGIIHRDLKPDNIIITKKGRAKVVDFGTAKLMPSIDITNVKTQIGHVLGTPAYMAPEQILQATPDRSLSIDHRTDIYAMGVLLYHAATGRKPFDGPTIYDVLRMQLHEQAQPPRLWRPDLPPGYEAVIMTAMAKEQHQRFQSAYDMGQALNQAVIGLVGNAWDPVSAMPDARHITLAPGQRLSSQHGTATPPPHAILSSSSGTHPVTAPPSSRTVRTALIAIMAAVLGAVLMAVLIGDSGAPASDASPADASDAAPASKDAASPEIGDAGDAGDASDAGTEDPAGGRGASSSSADSPDLERARKLLGASDPARFDALAFMATAQAYARETFSDAELTEMKLYPVAPDGTLDLTADPDAEAVFAYQSEKRAERREPCELHLKISWDSKARAARAGIEVMAASSCGDETIRPPRCSLAEVWQMARQSKVPEAPGAKISLWSRKSSRSPQWDVEVGSGADVVRKTLTDKSSCGH